MDIEVTDFMKLMMMMNSLFAIYIVMSVLQNDVKNVEGDICMREMFEEGKRERSWEL